MITMLVLIVVPTILFYGLRLLFHAIDPATYQPAGNPGLFSQLTNMTAEFGFIAAAALGAAVGTTDLSDGMFRHLVSPAGRGWRSTWPASRPAWPSASRSSPSCSRWAAWSLATRASPTPRQSAFTAYRPG